MKTIIVKGGLGNQIFEYAFSLYLKQKTGQEIRFLRRRRGRLSKIEKAELYSVFDVDIKSASWLIRWKYKLVKLLKKKQAISKEETFSLSTPFYEGYWQNQKYYRNLPKNWINFRNFSLSDKNKQTIEKMRTTNSVSIHVRRGNYLNKRNFEMFGSVCDKKYYDRAIAEICERVDNPDFFVFSNDVEWVEENFKMPNTTVVSWNQEDDSYLDLYLMCHCKYAIIANSTFSYWGAYLGTDKEIVIYPQKWLEPKYKIPDILPLDWMGV